MVSPSCTFAGSSEVGTVTMGYRNTFPASDPLRLEKPPPPPEPQPTSNTEATTAPRERETNDGKRMLTCSLHVHAISDAAYQGLSKHHSESEPSPKRSSRAVLAGSPDSAMALQKGKSVVKVSSQNRRFFGADSLLRRALMLRSTSKRV